MNMDFVVSADISWNNDAVNKKRLWACCWVRSTYISVLAILFCFIGQIASAQTSSGTISGRVVDASGGVVINAEVQLINEQTNVVLKTHVLSHGDFTFPDIQPGTFTVDVKDPDYRRCATDIFRLARNDGHILYTASCKGSILGIERSAPRSSQLS